ncbi:PAS domain S-box-containing protein/diguanylate cyclase (GGDEF)-like protein [Alkalispirillum mobile]|uniref:cyclic-guanylate-specific phosphodiesterase n=1 Tax=Alkalispirillum mobile TaxID=85925 RepID=A0A498C618_9GAMM|nr:PAS domain S-box-containing protein/diguanylate cyclase (GGDEF)-like protein [Alkalispirillum mobile]
MPNSSGPGITHKERDPSVTGANPSASAARASALFRENTLLRVLARSNQAVIRARAEHELLGEATRLLAEDAGYDLVCVLGPLHWGGPLECLASSGHDEGYLEQLMRGGGVSVRSHGPAGATLRSGQPTVLHNLAARQSPRPWRVEAVRRGFQSILALPLREGRGRDGAVFGTLVLHARDAGLLCQDSVRLLEDLAANLSHGVWALRMRERQRRMKAELRKHAQATENSPVSILITDSDARIEYVNPSFTRLTGYAPEEVVGQNPRVLSSGHTPQEVFRELWTTLRAGRTWQGTVQNRRKDGQLIWERQIISPLKGNDGRISHFVAVREDITESKRAESAIRLRERALESTANGILISDLRLRDNPIIYVNPAFERITGYSRDEVVGRNGRFLVRDDKDQPGLEEIRKALRARREAHAVIRNYRKDGTLFWNELFVAPVLEDDGSVHYMVSVINDVTERKRYQAELEQRTHYDALTGLPNRNLLADRLRQALLYARRSGRFVALLNVDVDRFQIINESLGHAAGDQLLRSVADRLTSALRGFDTVARMSGDEFNVVLTELRNTRDAELLTAELQDALTPSFSVTGQDVFLSVSIGYSVFPDDGDVSEDLVRRAGLAMHEAKRAGGGMIKRYSERSEPRHLDRLTLESDLQHALEREELRLFLQPQVDVDTGRLTGAEALLRWEHPTRGLVSPMHFIPLAEEVGLIIPMGRWVLQTVARQLAHWQQQGLPVVPVAVNISARQFLHQELVEDVRSMLEEHGILPGLLELELTESLMAHNPEVAVQILRELKAMGVRLALDDFGTGYSSLAHLKRFPIDTLKVDQSFMRQVTRDEDDAAIVTATIRMAHSLGLNVVAEGVEQESQRQYLAQQQCDYAQGYYFGKPMPLEAFSALLAGQGDGPNP